jgi:hypothetical protein
MRRWIRINRSLSHIDLHSPRFSVWQSSFSRQHKRECVIPFLHLFSRSRMGVFFHPGWPENCPDEKVCCVPSSQDRRTERMMLEVPTWNLSNRQRNLKVGFIPQGIQTYSVWIEVRAMLWRSRIEQQTAHPFECCGNSSAGKYMHKRNGKWWKCTFPHQRLEYLSVSWETNE